MNADARSENVRYVPADYLAPWAAALFTACGMEENEAELTAGVLVRTSLRGIDTHGIARIPVYAGKLLAAEVLPRAKPQTGMRHGVLHCDGHNAMGQVVASVALEGALRNAQNSAISICTMRNSGHLGALGIYVLQAAEQGMVALLCQKTPPIMALPGASSAAIGNNPIAFAMPVMDGPALVFDMASSVVARGNVLQAVRDQLTSIPAGWAIGPDGHPTTDPIQALSGAMLPVAGHKGIGIAMLVECLAGSLSGAAPMEVGDSSQNLGGAAANASAFLLVINPDLMFGRPSFEAHSKAWLQHFLQSSGADARYPGQRQAQCEAARIVGGIPVPASLYSELKNIGEKLGTPFDT